MLRELGQEVQRVEDLEIPRGPGREALVLRVEEGPAGVLLGLVDDLPGRGHLDQPRQAERAAGHVPDQTLDSGLVARRQKNRLVHAESAVRPGPHVLDYFRLDLVLGQVQGEHGFLPSRLQPLQVQLRQFQKLALWRERPAGQQHVKVRVPVEEFAERLDGGDPARLEHGCLLLPIGNLTDDLAEAGRSWRRRAGSGRALAHQEAPSGRPREWELRASGTSGGFAGFSTNPLTWTPGTWYHVVFVSDHKNGKTILRSNDAVWKRDANTLAPAELKSAVTQVSIGSLNGAYAFNGAVKDVQLFDRALTAAEQAAFYDSGRVAILALQQREASRARIVRQFQEHEAPRLPVAERQRKLEWLFQLEDDDVLTRADKEIGWTRAMIERFRKRGGVAGLADAAKRLKNLERVVKPCVPFSSASPGWLISSGALFRSGNRKGTADRRPRPPVLPKTVRCQNARRRFGPL